ncbi:DUF2786 domain-containing protein [Arsenicicoccus dermatophilus]|uniref:DUF2786 domain-containing protein n=1 Tax=Arsenicicoccus dermatophilus TaxID=1076331 RepID=UPI0039170CF5
MGDATGGRGATSDERAALVERATRLALDGVTALVREVLWDLDDAVTDLVVLAGSGGAEVVDQTLAQRLREVLLERWRTGWQPLDLHHVVQRADLHVRAEAPVVGRVAALVGDLVADDLGRYAAATVEPRWHDQLAIIQESRNDHRSGGGAAGRGAARPADPGRAGGTLTWLGARAASWGRAETYEAALRLEHVLRRVPALQQLGARPGHAVTPATRRSDVDDKVLARVRQLLAKAESTTYEAEAETFTAGAQALMARHSIDHALLAATAAGSGSAADGRPDGRRLWIETPYVREKVLLLGVVADANRARSVWAKEDGYVTLLGFGPDLDAVETLYTSLLVQATRAMHGEGRRQDAYGGSRTRSFRQSFLAAFATRIGERLAEVTAAETEQAAVDAQERGGQELVPVLAAREEAVESYLGEVFPQLRTVSMPLGRDREGCVRGRRAADRAALSWGRPLDR